MGRASVRAFEPGDLDQAARLLAERHRRHRLVEPLLSPRWEYPAVARAELSDVLEKGSGAVAEEDGRLTGFVLGSPKDSPMWGPNVWVEAAGLAGDDPETMRDMYAVAATRWVADERTAHYVIVPSHDPAIVDAWFRLGFGQQQAHGIRDLPTGEPAAKVTVRRARRDDIDALARLELALPDHQGLAPVFSAGTVPTYEETRAEWEADFDDESYAAFVAEVDGRVIGSTIACALEKSNLHLGPARPDNAGFMGFAAVLPEARGVGAGRALGETVGWWAAQSGYDCLVADWRVTNLLASRAWPRLGYRTTFLRLHRTIGY
jgi:ribosomal protein S18 acetylase RimI-like enzyme